ncbi:MTH1187 family thiamine-binding protein [Prosthecochloris sp. ZM_2]|nr:MTH1187 family thiamine-binding protein [Prosthecochloris sp. ZM_2]RNA65521.1 MTH1187 family thiamine-binding protein [Prosthecochloris sp. ZM_2]
MALMDLTVIPLGGASGGGLSRLVADLENMLAESGLEFRLHDMGTTVSGPAGELFAVASKLHEHVFSTGVARVYTVVKVDDRRDREVRLGDKVASVEARLAGSRGGQD